MEATKIQRHAPGLAVGYDESSLMMLFSLRNVLFYGILRKSISIRPRMMPTHLTDVLNACERSGKLNVRAEDLHTALPDVSDEGLRKALHRQQRRGRLVRVSHGSGHWLIVPLRHAVSGAPPLETWLDRYMCQTLQTPYYVGLLSAAETYGASPYAVMLTQVLVPAPRRPITVGRHEVVFHTRVRLEQMPTQWHETPEGRFKISTPGLTVLDILQRETALGGIARVREVLQGLWGRCTPEGLTHALEVIGNVPLAQRLGALIALDNETELIPAVEAWLDGKPMRPVALEGRVPPDHAAFGCLDGKFKVWSPEQSWGANT